MVNALVSQYRTNFKHQTLKLKLKLHKSVRFRLPLLIPQKIQSEDPERKKNPKQNQHLIADSNSLHSLLCWLLFDVKQYQRALFFSLVTKRMCNTPRERPFPIMPLRKNTTMHSNCGIENGKSLIKFGRAGEFIFI